jgi:hypothetical protein
MSAPDLIEPFMAWKGLRADQDGQLYSPAMETPWPAAAPLEATCDTDPKHSPPVETCRCGVYGVKTFEDLAAAGYNWSAEYEEDGLHFVAVVAKIKLWGRIRRGTTGFRAEFAYPSKIYVPAGRLSLGAVIRRRYGCALGIVNRFTGERR